MASKFAVTTPLTEEDWTPGASAVTRRPSTPPRGPLGAQAPAPQLDSWNHEIVNVLNDPGVKDALSKHGLTPQPTTRAELAAFMKKEDAKWSAVVRERRITAD